MKRKNRGKDPPYFKVSFSTVESREFKSLPPSAQVLFFHLCKLRNRLTKGNNWSPDHRFWRSDQQLMAGSGLARRTIQRARADLVKKNFLHVDVSDKRFLQRFGPVYTLLDDVYQQEMDKFYDSDALEYHWLVPEGDTGGSPEQHS